MYDPESGVCGPPGLTGVGGRLSRGFEMRDEEGMNFLDEVVRGISPISGGWIARAEERQLQLTKPPSVSASLSGSPVACAVFSKLYNQPQHLVAL